MENLVANYTDPTSRPVDPGVEQSDPSLGERTDPSLGERTDPRLGAAVPSGTFADSEMEYPGTERSGEQYGQPVSFEEGGSTVETAKSEAANVKDTAADAASEVKEVAKGEVSNVASEAKYQTRNLVDQTRTELRGQAINQQSQLAAKLQGWSSELGSMASRSDQSGQMTDLASEAARRGGEIAHWLDTHEPADVLEEVRRFARRRPVAFLALAAAAGLVAGRLTRGAVAANTSVDSGREATPARAYGSETYDRGGIDGGFDSGTPGGGTYGARSYQRSGYDPGYGEVAGETSYQGGGMPTRGQYSPADPEAEQQYPSSTGSAYPDVTPTTEESYYPPSAEGEVRR